MGAPVLSKLSAQECLAENCELGELGPMMAVLRPHCVEAPTLIITCDMQRNDTQLTWGQTYLDFPDQCSPTPRKRENGKSIQAVMSLGKGVCDWNLRAAIFNSRIERSANGDGRRIDFRDEPGKEPQYYEVALIPYDGGVPSTQVAIVFYYAMLMTENVQEVYGVSTPRELTFTIYGERHPVTGLRASMFDDPAEVQKLLPQSGEV
jgi:hypothetical protein